MRLLYGGQNILSYMTFMSDLATCCYSGQNEISQRFCAIFLQGRDGIYV